MSIKPEDLLRSFAAWASILADARCSAHVGNRCGFEYRHVGGGACRAPSERCNRTFSGCKFITSSVIAAAIRETGYTRTSAIRLNLLRSYSVGLRAFESLGSEELQLLREMFPPHGVVAPGLDGGARRYLSEQEVQDFLLSLQEELERRGQEEAAELRQRMIQTKARPKSPSRRRMIGRARMPPPEPIAPPKRRPMGPPGRLLDPASGVISTQGKPAAPPLPFSAAYPSSSLWNHGLVPCLVGTDQGPDVQLTGAWEGGGVISDPEVKYATDGSPGSNQDPRCWRLRWAAIAFKVSGDSVTIIGQAIGAVQCEQTVFRAEAMAALFVAGHTEGGIDIILDCLGVKKQTESHRSSRKSEDLFDGLRSEQDRIHMVWIRSHLTQQEFTSEYVANQLWRWRANQEVDYLVGRAANSARDFQYESALNKQDQDAHVALDFLSRRVCSLFSLDGEASAQIEFRRRRRVEHSSSDDASNGRTKVNANSRTHLKQQKRKQKAAPTPEEQPAPLSSGEGQQAMGVCPPKPLNKRDKMKLALAESWGGHSWTFTSERRDGACMKCQKCDLGVQQICPERQFNRLIAHPCKAEATSEFFQRHWQTHASHKMRYVGPTWECDVCGRIHKPGCEATHPVLLQPCSADNMTQACRQKRAKASAADGRTAGSASANSGRAVGDLQTVQERPRPADQQAAKKRLFAVPVREAGHSQPSVSCSNEVAGSGAGEQVEAVRPSPARPKPKPKAKQNPLKQTKLFFK